jgi:hypothetical protein
MRQFVFLGAESHASLQFRAHSIGECRPAFMKREVNCARLIWRQSGIRLPGLAEYLDRTPAGCLVTAGKAVISHNKIY